MISRLKPYFYSYSKPDVPYIPQHDALRNIFPVESSQVLWLFADHTFPLFCAMLDFNEYSENIILGLTASIGQLTESLVKYSSIAFFNYIKNHKENIPRIGQEIMKVFEQNLLDERVTCPLLSFLDIVLSSGTFFCYFFFIKVRLPNVFIMLSRLFTVSVG